MHRLVVSAPFGNYVQPPFATATLGTFTAKERPGRWWRTVKTVRYYPRLKAWVNQIGLRNPGIDWLVGRASADRSMLEGRWVSVHGFQPDEWWLLLERVRELMPSAVELNMSCPNVGEIDWPPELFSRAMSTQVPVVVKLPPVNFELMFEQAYEAGIRRFHACNTLPVPAGGLSGAPLKPVALACIRRLRQLVGETAQDELRVLGGGGIRAPEDVDAYAEEGVHAVAVGTKVMNPRYLLSAKALQPIAERATQKLGHRPSFL